MNRTTTFGGSGGTYSPMIYDYLRRWQEDPTSRVFAPLAEAYRKAGMVDEAIEIAQDGVRVHPNYLGGRVALARALFDRKRYHEVIEQLEMSMQNAPDNLAGQRLLGESFLMTGRVAEALASYKLLLYFSPMDVEAARLVKELEAQAYEQGVLVLRTDLARPESIGPRLVVGGARQGPIRGAGAPGEGMDSFSERPLQVAISSDPALKRQEWVGRVEFLQGLLLRVERYKLSVEQRGLG
jgi:tetratricopeptide (TPR) repeat protein